MKKGTNVLQCLVEVMSNKGVCDFVFNLYKRVVDTKSSDFYFRNNDIVVQCPCQLDKPESKYLSESFQYSITNNVLCFKFTSLQSHRYYIQ